MVPLEVHTGLGYTHHCRPSSAGPGAGTAEWTEDSHRLSAYFPLPACMWCVEKVVLCISLSSKPQGGEAADIGGHLVA